MAVCDVLCKEYVVNRYDRRRFNVAYRRYYAMFCKAECRIYGDKGIRTPDIQLAKLAL